MRVVALLATYNEERFVAGCLEHLRQHGVETYVVDNESTDATVEIAEAYRGRGVIGIERFPREGHYPWTGLLRRKAELAAEIDADWFVHLDADEVRLPPRPGLTLAEGLAEADADGANAVNFLELTFVPTVEHPDHDHERYAETMRWYYPYLPAFPDRLNAWKRQPEPVDLASSGGHRVAFPGLRPHQESFPMRHYLFLSVEHAVRKYVERVYDSAETALGMHRRRAALRREDIALQPEAELREVGEDGALDPSDPLTVHPLFASVQVSG